MEPIKFFDSTEYLDPKCPTCDAKIDYGTTTEYDDDKECHICTSCRSPLN